MPPIELGPMRPVGAGDVRLAQTASAKSEAKPRAEAATGAIVQSAALDALEPGQPPVDVERVAQVRKAVEQGTYPLLPTKVADAIIAAGVILRSAK